MVTMRINGGKHGVRDRMQCNPENRIFREWQESFSLFDVPAHIERLRHFAALSDTTSKKSKNKAAVQESSTNSASSSVSRASSRFDESGLQSKQRETSGKKNAGHTASSRTGSRARGKAPLHRSTPQTKSRSTSVRNKRSSVKKKKSIVEEEENIDPEQMADAIAEKWKGFIPLSRFKRLLMSGNATEFFPATGTSNGYIHDDSSAGVVAVPALASSDPSMISSSDRDEYFVEGALAKEDVEEILYQAELAKAVWYPPRKDQPNAHSAVSSGVNVESSEIRAMCRMNLCDMDEPMIDFNKLIRAMMTK